MNKQELRKLFRDKLKSNSKSKFPFFNFVRKLNSIKLLCSFIKLYNSYENLQKCKTIALYYPLYYEINCLPIATWLKLRNIITLLPKINNSSKKLDFYFFNQKDKMLKNAIGIKEPSSDSKIDPDALIVPLLAFDSKGNRLGQGGGFYDYTLASLKNTKDIIAIGAAYSQQEVPFLPTLKHDIKLNAVITEKFYKIF